MALSGGGEDKEEMRMSCYLGFNPVEKTQDRSNKVQVDEDGAGDDDDTCSRSRRTTIYRECLKNHAAAAGGSVRDGCGEFMPSGEDGTMEAFKCAACSCHRNFHRKLEASTDAIVVAHPLHQLQPPPLLLSPRMMKPWRRTTEHWTCTPMAAEGAVAQPVRMAFGGGTGAVGLVGTDYSSSEDMSFNADEQQRHQANRAAAPPAKRSRTKFTQEQKEKMAEFAEKIGWRIPREDDSELQRFCVEVGVKRKVFKVWMHNNKISSSSSSANKNLKSNNIINTLQI